MPTRPPRPLAWIARPCICIGLLLACDPAPSSSEPSHPPPTATPPIAIPPPPAPPPVVAGPPTSRRCLPVVAAACGCVYTCGLGTELEPGRWRVAHDVWAPEPILARVDRWCVDGRCTDAFFGEIVCSGVCPPRPAEPNCRLVGDRCEAVAPDAPR